MQRWGSAREQPPTHTFVVTLQWRGALGSLWLAPTCNIQSETQRNRRILASVTCLAHLRRFISLYQLHKLETLTTDNNLKTFCQQSLGFSLFCLSETWGGKNMFRTLSKILAIIRHFGKKCDWWWNVGPPRRSTGMPKSPTKNSESWYREKHKCQNKSHNHADLLLLYQRNYPLWICSSKTVKQGY